MSRTPLRAFIVVSMLLALLIVCGRFALAGAESLEDAIAGAMTPSTAPAMLGPITSAGRTGWECKPERAASSSGWHQAELPAGPGNP